MVTTVFDTGPLPDDVARGLRALLSRAHAETPFSTVDVRATVRRVAELLRDLPVDTVAYRGGLDLRGAEVDHVWLAVAPTRGDGLARRSWVLDVAFPLFDDAFVTLLRRFVAGDAAEEELDEVARASGLDRRVLGLVPEPMRYLGSPVWSARRGGTAAAV